MAVAVIVVKSTKSAHAMAMARRDDQRKPFAVLKAGDPGG